MARLEILNISNVCTGCSACISICPKSALTLDYNKDGYYQPILDENKCVQCRLCEKVCYVCNNIEMNVEEKHSTSAIMLKAKGKRPKQTYCADRQMCLPSRC